MSYQDKAIQDTLIEIEQLLRLQVGKKTLSKTYYEYRISKVNIKDLKLPLYKLYHLAFEQGVYVKKEKELK
ncbi:MAG: hypothetical protein AABY22_09820 [Nanoarchaeota archaeon]